MPCPDKAKTSVHKPASITHHEFKILPMCYHNMYPTNATCILVSKRVVLIVGRFQKAKNLKSHLLTPKLFCKRKALLLTTRIELRVLEQI